MKVLYFCATGSNDPTKASIPFHIGANGSHEVGDEVAFVLGGDAAELVVADVADRVEGKGLPPLRELMAKVKENSLTVYV